MEFIEVKDNIIENMDFIDDIFPDIGGAKEFLQEAIYSLDQAINDLPYPGPEETSLGLVNTLLNKLIDLCLFGELRNRHIQVMGSIIELISNWLALYEIRDGAIERNIKIIDSLLRVSRTLDEQINILGALYKKINYIYLSEPIETRISQMYRNKLESYFEGTKQGEYYVK